ncbi:MAG: septum formation protein Maf [Polyangiaceae bacterium]|nr:septum formation protein Maf [Polyangiaceae bacterium]
MNVPPIVLASTSPYRMALLEKLGLPIQALSPKLDERAFEQSSGLLSTQALASALALEKAKSLASDCPGALIIGADQIAEINGQRLYKPGSPENAVAQLEQLAGRTHRLITAVSVFSTQQNRAETSLFVHHLTMRSLPRQALVNYVARDSPIDCAGSYKIESLGIALFEEVTGNDFTAIVGLPLTGVVTLLGRFGVQIL